jgi:D-alanyl-D-alanine carboxypeptidase
VKKRRLKKEVKLYGTIILIGIIILVFAIMYISKTNSLTYKLKKKGYTKDDISNIIKLTKEEINIILKKEYNSDLVPLITEKYFIFNNLDKYLEYQKNNPIDYKVTVSIINTSSNEKVYENIKDTDTSQGNLMLVNKYYKLSSDYNPELVTIKSLYAYQGNQVTKETNDALERMFIEAKKDGFTLIVKNSYRSYESQEKIYNSLKNSKGVAYADKVAARPGHSDHQTGLAVDIEDYKKQGVSFENTDAYLWVKENAYKYGFIERYEESKEEITKFKKEPYHLRYVGVEAAKEMFRHNITLDEYYSYYIEK